MLAVEWGNCSVCVRSRHWGDNAKVKHDSLCIYWSDIACLTNGCSSMVDINILLRNAWVFPQWWSTGKQVGYTTLVHFIWVAAWQNQQNDLSSLIRVFAVCMKKHWALNYLFSAQWRLWSDWVDAHADLSLCWAHMSFCWFCCAADHIISVLTVDCI